tara:strand:+ start:2387 stop:3631 length:1245 start_codon:yes stop_codon:yes gene_type:complete
MKFKNIKLLNDVVLDYSNPFKMFALAKEYDKLKQGAAAFGWYLRAADFCEGETYEEKELQYKCMVLGAAVFARSEARTQTVKGLIKAAIAVLPARPEAYYWAAKYSIDQNNFRNAMMYAKMGKDCDILAGSIEPNEELNYPGPVGLEYCYAIAKWKSDGRDDSKNLFFDLKHKRKLDMSDEMAKSVDWWIEQVGYPSTLPYTQNEKHKYRYKFDGLDTVVKNYSRHFQDMFVLSLLNGKKNGTFIEVGSGHPKLFNNTYLLEDKFDWRGISLDISERMCAQHSRERKSSIVLADANKINFSELFKQHCLESKIDFLRINADAASLNTLQGIPFNEYEFSTIQIQHNACWWGDELKNKTRKILSEIGYVLMVPDVAVDENNAYEDWWVHPGFVKKEMATKKGANFAWNYMMKERV